MNRRYWKTWLGAIAGMALLGCLLVFQRTALMLEAYSVGDKMLRVHTRGTEVAWLETSVAGLNSPVRLAKEVEDRKLKLVAWERLVVKPVLIRLAAAVPLSSLE